MATLLYAAVAPSACAARVPASLATHRRNRRTGGDKVTKVLRPSSRGRRGSAVASAAKTKESPPAKDADGAVRAPQAHTHSCPQERNRREYLFVLLLFFLFSGFRFRVATNAQRRALFRRCVGVGGKYVQARSAVCDGRAIIARAEHRGVRNVRGALSHTRPNLETPSIQ